LFMTEPSQGIQFEFSGRNRIAPGMRQAAIVDLQNLKSNVLRGIPIPTGTGMTARSKGLRNPLRVEIDSRSVSIFDCNYTISLRANSIRPLSLPGAPIMENPSGTPSICINGTVICGHPLSPEMHNILIDWFR